MADNMFIVTAIKDISADSADIDTCQHHSDNSLDCSRLLCGKVKRFYPRALLHVKLCILPI